MFPDLIIPAQFATPDQINFMIRQARAITGFQLRVRMPSYRGMAASLIDGIAVRVGTLVDVPAEVPLWTFGTTTYTLAELWQSEGVRWQLEDAAVVTVPFPGGSE